MIEMEKLEVQCMSILTSKADGIMSSQFVLMEPRILCLALQSKILVISTKMATQVDNKMVMILWVDYLNAEFLWHLILKHFKKVMFVKM